jgi:fatty-acid desaturase
MREFMEEDEAAVERELPDVCEMLRTKNAFGNHIGYRPWQKGQSSTAVYWCLHTMATVGPDDHLAHPHTCCSGRRCFQSGDM